MDEDKDKKKICPVCNKPIWHNYNVHIKCEKRKEEDWLRLKQKHLKKQNKEE